MNLFPAVFVFVMILGLFAMATTAGNTITGATASIDKWGCTIKVGSDMIGEVVGESFGRSVDISSDGNTVIAGGEYSPPEGIEDEECESLLSHGYVRVYQYQEDDENKWIQLGATLFGEDCFDGFGYSVAVSSDGSRIVIGAPYNNDNGSNSGHVRIFEDQGDSWEQLGDDIDGRAENDYFGSSVAISDDGDHIIVGAPQTYAGPNSGYVRIFNYQEGEWVQLGDDLHGEAPVDVFGDVVAMSGEGNRVVIGAHGAYCSGGYAHVFGYQDTEWVQEDIDSSHSLDDFCVTGVAVSNDGNRIVVGTEYNGDASGNYDNAQVYHYEGDHWLQLGDDLFAPYDWFGWSVTISQDGTYVVASAPLKDGSTSIDLNVGYASVHHYQDENWVKIAEIKGDTHWEHLGNSVAISGDGDRVVVTSWRGTGKVIVLSISECETS